MYIGNVSQPPHEFTINQFVLRRNVCQYGLKLEVSCRFARFALKLYWTVPVRSVLYSSIRSLHIILCRGLTAGVCLVSKYDNGTQQLLQHVNILGLLGCVFFRVCSVIRFRASDGCFSNWKSDQSFVCNPMLQHPSLLGINLADRKTRYKHIAQ